MLKRTAISLALMATGILAGCSSSQTKEEAMQDYVAAQEIKEEHQQKVSERNQQKAEEFLELAPEWYLKPPQSDEKGIYAVAVGTSTDIATALRKAELQANYGLATKIKNIVSAEETMTGSSDANYRFIVNSFVDRVDVSSSELVSRNIKIVDGKYNAFVMMLYPYSSLHSDMVKANALRNSLEIDTAYNRLMKRIKESQAAELEQAKLSVASALAAQNQVETDKP
jgi:hypothetical protein